MEMCSCNSYFKSGDRRQCENYRSISILPTVSKAFEKAVFRQLYSYLTETSMLSKFQSGIRPNHSTLRALIQMCDEWLENMGDSKLNGVLFLDIKKAFDSIYHDILITMETRQVKLGLACFSYNINFINKVLLTYLDYVPDGLSAEFYVSVKFLPEMRSPTLSIMARYWDSFPSPRGS